MKKSIFLLLILVLMFNLIPNKSFAEGSKSPQNIVYVNGERVIFDIAPIEEKGVKLVQFKPLFVALGLSVNFDSKTKIITGKNKDYEIELQIGNSKAKVNNKEVTLSVAPKTIKGNTFVPLKFVSQVTGNKIYVDADTKRVMIGYFWNYSRDRYFEYNWRVSSSDLMKTTDRTIKENFIESDGSGMVVYDYKFSNKVQGSLVYSFSSSGLGNVMYSTEESDNLADMELIYLSFLNYYSKLYHEDHFSSLYSIYSFGEAITVNVSLRTNKSVTNPKYSVEVLYHEGI
ncbi:copper amine oxidase N-terminal domain-containing protein [Paenibacillus sp. NPDC058174]|uniref:copper amine oxidase N-terminal domain-containing protein n=1 Tax=Paenibacillus sp. NPDC058174 TaxID=3346366 RepID=UPI0036DD5D35